MKDLVALFHNPQRKRRAAEHNASHGKTRRVRSLRQAWMQFCVECGLPATRNFRQPYDPIPDMNQIEAFLRYLCRTKKGVLNKKISVRTIQNHWEYLRRDIKQCTGHVYDMEDRQDLELQLRKDFVLEEQLSTKARPKPLADLAVVTDVLKFLWQSDEKQYEQPRMRAQIALAIQLMWFCGLRTGEMLSSTEHGTVGNNEGLHWKDFEIYMTPDKHGLPSFDMRVAIRNRKGRRNRQDKVEQENLRENQQNRWFCPATLVLSLAIADRAIDGISSVDDLSRVRFDPATPRRLLAIRADKRDLPVIRRGLLGTSETSHHLIMESSSFSATLKVLGWRAGYKDDLLPYALRRGVGNRLDKHLTSAERSRAIGHQNPTTFLHYISKIAPCDVQNIMSGEAADQDTIDFFRSMRASIDTSAPVPLGSHLSDPRRRGHADRQAGLSTHADAMKMRFEHFSQQRPLFEGLAKHVPIGAPLPRMDMSPLLTNVLRYDSGRAAVIESFFTQSTETIFPAIEAVVLAVQPKPWFYPGALPANGACPVCCESNFAQHRFANHILRCVLSSCPGTVFCFACAKTLDTESWNMHCQGHLEKLQLCCNTVLLRGIVIQPGLCPCCLGAADAEPSLRYRQFRDNASLTGHIESHLCKQLWPMSCPHPLCGEEQYGSPQSYWSHLETTHGFHPAQTQVTPDREAEHAKNISCSSEAPGKGLVEDRAGQGCLSTICGKQPGCPLQCKAPGCRATFSEVERFFDHAKTHVGKWCPIAGCGAWNRNLSSLRKHVLDLHHLSGHICDMDAIDGPGQTCGKPFLTPSALEIHKHVHRRAAQSQEFRCPWDKCGKISRDAETLKRHLSVTHEGTPPYECSWPGCGRRFFRPCRRREHERKCHDQGEEATFPAISTRSELTRVAHNQEQTHACSMCGAGFPSWKLRRAHIVKVHNHSAFVCTTCGRACRDNSHLLHHMRSHQRKVAKAAERLRR